jgi:hypothetical protein
VGGGIAIYIANDLIYDTCETIVENYEKLSLKIRVNNNWLKLIAYYRPPTPNNINDFLQDLEKELSDDTIINKIIVGDMNINIHEDSTVSREYKLLLDSYSAEIRNNQITRNRSNAILDHIISQSEGINLSTQTLELPGFSDHNAVLSNFEVERKQSKGKTILKKFVNHKKLTECFEINEDEFNNVEGPNEKVELLMRSIENSLEKSTTLKRYKVKHPTIVDSWLSVKVLELMKTKDQLSSKLRKRRRLMQPCDAIETKIKKLTDKIKKAKINSYEAHFDNVIKNGDTKSIWKEINDCIGLRKETKKILIEKNGKLLTEDQIVCDTLNNYFINVGENIIPAVNISVEKLNKFNTLTQIENSIFLDPTSCEEVYNEILTLNKNKSAGSDNINVAVIKTLINPLTPLITDIINTMIKHGIFPDILKEGIVTAIPKIPNAKEESDFRPITVLNCISKPIEKIINSRLEKFFNKNKILDNNQFGFVKKSSTECAIMELHHRALSALSKDKKLGIVIIDLKKAFDSMPHATTLHKLHCYGIRGNAFDLMKSYFEKRTQAVKIGNTVSKISEINRGIAQGGITSPLMFNIGLNDFKDLPLKADTQLRYADDTVLIYEFIDEKEFAEKVRHDMKITVDYFALNGMALNIDKSSFLIFHKKKVDHLPNKIIIDDNNTLNRVSSCRYLGIIFDEHLTFDDHIKSIKKKLTLTVNLIRKLKWFLPTNILKSIYYAHFHSHLCYIPFVWGFVTETAIKPIQILQNRALKHTFKLPILFHTEELYTGPAKGILPVKGIVAQHTFNFIHKSINNINRSNIKFGIINGETRQNGQLSRSREISTKTTYGRRDILNVAPILYNKLPKDFRNTRFGTFKFKLKKILETFSSQLLKLKQFSLFDLKFTPN